HFGLATEPLALGVRGMLGGQDHFQRDHPSQARLACPVDDAHTTTPQLAKDLVARHSNRGGGGSLACGRRYRERLYRGWSGRERPRLAVGRDTLGRWHRRGLADRVRLIEVGGWARRIRAGHGESPRERMRSNLVPAEQRNRWLSTPLMLRASI